MSPSAKVKSRASRGKVTTTPSAKKVALGAAKTISQPRTSTTPKGSTKKSKAVASVAAAEEDPPIRVPHDSTENAEKASNVPNPNETAEQQPKESEDDPALGFFGDAKLPTPRDIARVNYTIQIQLMPDWVDDPHIWRDLSVPTNITFQKLHQAIQIAFGWGGGHNWAFSIQSDVGMRATASERNELHMGPTEMFGFEDEMIQKRPGDVKLHEVFEDAKYKDGVMKYEYDFGDGWEHMIKVVGYEKQSKDIICRNGNGHGIPDDCGGPPGWEALKDAYRTSRPNKEQKELRRWFENSWGDKKGLGNGREHEWEKDAVNAKLKRC